MRLVIRVLSVLVLSGLVFADADLLSARWSLVGMNVTAQYRNGAVTFDFPAAPQSVNWLIATTPKRFTLAGRLSVTVQIDATDGTLFNYQLEPWNTCVSPATARPYFEVANWSGRRLKRGESADNFRWWSPDVAIVLADGLSTVTVPLVPDAWSNVNGQRGSMNPAGFAWALGQVGGVGLTFGGGCFYGHGVNVQGGSASFSLVNYSVGS